jgi:hypothetical protein
MATDLKTRDKAVLLTRYYGGEERGTCVQVSTDFGQYIQLTRKQAEQLALDLLDFAAKQEMADYE